MAVSWVYWGSSWFDVTALRSLRQVPGRVPLPGGWCPPVAVTRLIRMLELGFLDLRIEGVRLGAFCPSPGVFGHGEARRSKPRLVVEVFGYLRWERSERRKYPKSFTTAVCGAWSRHV